ncbi:hypothetical protein G9A89_006691 [Geosiphon pyriformis]|nr:hypothetical protein G9A89_006691 [Geosiphon pyriformis]
MTSTTYTTTSSYHSSPRSPPAPLVTIDVAISSPENSDFSGGNSPPNHGRRLRVQELLSFEGNNLHPLPILNSLSLPNSTSSLPRIKPQISTPSQTPNEFFDSVHYLQQHLKIPEPTSLTNNTSNNNNNNNNNSNNNNSSSSNNNSFNSRHSNPQLQILQLLSPSTSSSAPNSAITPTQQQQPPSPLLYQYAAKSISSPTVSSPGALDDPLDPLSPLTLHERRERNKVASAKYRAKKHKQTQEMSSQIQELNSRISALTAENGLLGRQMKDLKEENLGLKTIVDELKSQLVEDKILKRLDRSGVIRRGIGGGGGGVGKNNMKIDNSNSASKRERARHGNSGYGKGTMGNNIQNNKP